MYGAVCTCVCMHMCTMCICMCSEHTCALCACVHCMCVHTALHVCLPACKAVQGVWLHNYSLSSAMTHHGWKVLMSLN